MTIKYRIHNMWFDSAEWATVINNLTIPEQRVLQEMTGLSDGCFWHWRKNQYPPGFEYPSMTNFLLICNHLDLDPRRFFAFAV